MLRNNIARNITRNIYKGLYSNNFRAVNKLSLPTSTSVTAFKKFYSNNIPTDGTSTPIGKVDPKLRISFTCTVPDCNTRSSHEFSKNSYEKGIVLVKCPGCNNRHLIADNLGWFKQEATNDGKLKNVEDLVKAKGEHVRRGTITGDEIHYE